METPKGRPVCHRPKQEVSDVLLRGWRTSSGSLSDAFIFSWAPELMYAYPAIPLILRVLRKIWQDVALMIMLDQVQAILVCRPDEPANTASDVKSNPYLGFRA